jgi:hypothetical protein
VLPTVSGKRAALRTGAGQQLFVTTLLPADAQPAAELAEPLKESSEPAELEPMMARLRVESRARDVRFLHVLEGADRDGAPDAPGLVDAGEDFVAVAVHARGAACAAGAPASGGAKGANDPGGAHGARDPAGAHGARDPGGKGCAIVVAFPRDAGDAPRALSDGGKGVTLAAPAGARAIALTGLVPDGEYAVGRLAGGRVHVTRGSGARADSGGVLWISF